MHYVLLITFCENYLMGFKQKFTHWVLSVSIKRFGHQNKHLLTLSGSHTGGSHNIRISGKSSIFVL